MNALESEPEQEVASGMSLWFRLVASLLLLWSLFWVYIYYISNSLNEAQLAAMPEAGRQLYLDIPGWIVVTGAFGIAASIVGLALLQLGKKISLWFLVGAAVGVILRDGWFMVDGRVWDLIPGVSLILSSSTAVIYLLQIPFGVFGTRKGWLR